MMYDKTENNIQELTKKNSDHIQKNFPETSEVAVKILKQSDVKKNDELMSSNTTIEVNDVEELMEENENMIEH